MQVSWAKDGHALPEAALKGTILFLHGLALQKETCGFWAYQIAAAGYRAVLVDLRGHGQSTGDWLTYGVVESRDIVRVIDRLDEKGLLAGKVGLFGESYGAAVALQTAARDDRVRAVVALAAFFPAQHLGSADVALLIDEVEVSFLSLHAELLNLCGHSMTSFRN